MAYQCFKDIVNDIFNKSEISNFEQTVNNRVKFHYSWEKPNNGYLDLNWSFNKTIAFLHAMDYGPLKMLGESKIKYESDTYTWDKYQVRETYTKSDEKINLEENSKVIIIQKENHIITLFNIRKIKEESG